MCVKCDLLKPFFGQLLEVMWRGASCDMASSELDRFMAQYMCDSRLLLKDEFVPSLATDKGTVNGLPLLNTVICTPGNLAVLAPPAVAFWTPRRQIPPSKFKFRCVPLCRSRGVVIKIPAPTGPIFFITTPARALLHFEGVFRGRGGHFARLMAAWTTSMARSGSRRGARNGGRSRVPSALAASSNRSQTGTGLGSTERSQAESPGLGALAPSTDRRRKSGAAPWTIR